MTSRLEVYIKGVYAGELERKGAPSYEFTYDEAYRIDSGLPALCLNMPKSQAVYESERLFPVFANMLAEGYNCRLQSRTMRIDENDDLLNTHLHMTNPHIFALSKNLYPGMIIDDTHSVTGTSFEEFGKLLGLPAKLVEKELDGFRVEKPQVKVMLDSCGLPENLVKGYFDGYDYRRKTLSF